MTLSLATPSKIRDLQIKLYRKAKNQPGYRFYLLYDKIYREDIVAHAYELVKSNKGAPGVDGQGFEEIESRGLGEWLTGIRQELRGKTYQPQPVRRVMIPKPGGGERPLGIPAIRDRLVQTAANLVLEPVFEAHLEPNACGYRPDRSAQDPIREVHKLLCEGYTDVVDADLSRHFDTIPHRELLQCVARRIVDRDVLRLIEMWLTAPVEEREENGKRLRVTTNLDIGSVGGTEPANIVSGAPLKNPAFNGDPASGPYIHPVVFFRPANFTFGNSGPNLPGLRSPAALNGNLCVGKTFDFAGEGRRLHFKLSAFNIFNRHRLGGINTQFESCSFERLSFQVNRPREIQFSLKLVF